MDWKSIVFYILMLSIVAWFILKVTGILHSPTLIELYPWFAVAAGAGIAYGKMSSALKTINHKLNDLKDLPLRISNQETVCKITHKR